MASTYCFLRLVLIVRRFRISHDRIPDFKGSWVDGIHTKKVCTVCTHQAYRILSKPLHYFKGKELLEAYSIKTKREDSNHNSLELHFINLLWNGKELKSSMFTWNARSGRVYLFIWIMPTAPSLIFCSEYAGRKTVLSCPKLNTQGRRKKESSLMCTKAFGPRGGEIHTTLQPDKNVSKLKFYVVSQKWFFSKSFQNQFQCSEMFSNLTLQHKSDKRTWKKAFSLLY